LGPQKPNPCHNVDSVPGTARQVRKGANKGVRMTTEDAVSSMRVTRKRARRVGYGLIAGFAALTLAGCSSGETFVDGWWDNGDPVMVPVKATLFDTSGKPLCTTPTAYGQVETRSRSFSENGGVINAFLFEVNNPETDPSTAANAQERKKLTVLQDSLGAMYQLTFPSFDKKHEVKSSSDMRKIKDDLHQHLPDLFKDSKLVSDYIAVDSQWIDGPQGHFAVRRESDPEGYIKENKIKTTFDGITYQYLLATKDDGTEYLLERNKETGGARLLRAGEKPIVLDESTESFIRYNIENEAGGVNPDATITLVDDQCLPVGTQQAARYWVYDYQTMNGTEQKPVNLT